MSGSIFGDDDDFELVGGSDTPSAIRKPPPVATPAVRPVAPQTPSTPASTAGESKNTSNRKLPAVSTPSALPRPQLPLPTSKESPARRVLPEKVDPSPIAPKPVSERRVEVEKPPVAPVREIPSRDTTRRQRTATPAVAPVDHSEKPDQRYVEQRPATPVENRYVERENSEPSVTPISRRDARGNSNGYEDFLSNDESESTPTNLREEIPKGLYTQTPYTPIERQRTAPHRVEQPIQSYPEVRTSPAAERPRQDVPVETKAPAKTTRFTKGKKEKATKEKGPSSFSGGRAGVVVVRVFAIAIVVILMLAGGKSIFFPPQIPDPTTVTNVVKKRLGVTNFPAEGGQAFVTSFARLYFTVDPSNSNSYEAYTPYMGSNLIASMTTSSGAVSKQTITEGPIVSGVKSIDDANAIYTVGAKLSTGNWMYVDIPVYYDKDNVGFAISGMPAFAPAPAKITVPPVEPPFVPDAKLADSIKSSVMEQFFPAWASSNTAGINLIVLGNANSEAKIGLSNSVKFGSIQSFSVEQKKPEDADENTRKAQATVVWASPTDAKITYTQQYNLILFRQPDGRWYIKELNSGVRS